MAGLCWQGIREYCLLSGSELTRCKSNEAKTIVAYHYAFDGALLRGNYVISVDRHWVTIAVILKGSRT